MATFKIKEPAKLEPEGLTETSFLIWKQELTVFLKTVPAYRKFMGTGKYTTWLSQEEFPDRIKTVHAQDAGASLEDIQCDLEQFITIVAKYVNKGYYLIIIKHCTSIDWIYKRLRQDFDIEHKGIHFLNIADLSYDPETTSPMEFYNQYRELVMSNLKPKDTQIIWKDNLVLKEDEKMSASHEELVLLIVLEKIHSKLPKYIKKHYSDRIGQTKSIMDYRSEMLRNAKEYIQKIEEEEAQAASIQHVMQNVEPPPQLNYIRQYRKQQPKYQSNYNNQQQPRYQSNFSNQQRPRFQQPPKFHDQSAQRSFCILCRQMGKPRHIFSNHNYATLQCPSISNKDRERLKELYKVTEQVNAINIDKDDEEDLMDEFGYTLTDETDDTQVKQKLECKLNFIQPVPSQMLSMKDANDMDVHLELDSGANVSFCKLSAVKAYGFKINPNGQLSNLADGKTKLPAIGEVDQIFYRNNFTVRFHAIVTKDLHCDFIAGNNFIKGNKVIQDFDAHTITVHKKYCVPETNKALILPTNLNNIILQNNQISVLLPGGQFQLPVPHSDNTTLAVQSWHQAKQNQWIEPQLCTAQNGKISVTNNTNYPIHIPKAKFQIRTLSEAKTFDNEKVNFPYEINCNVQKEAKDNTHLIEINEEGIDKDIIQQIKNINQTYRDVFDENLEIGYNHRAGKHIVNLNWANETRPDASKVQNINYDTDSKILLQKVCDDLENKGVLGVPSGDVTIQHCSPAFLVKKQRAKGLAIKDLSIDQVRLVVNFSKINDFLKNIPAPVVKNKDIFTALGKWNYIISTDLYSGFFQNHLSSNDYKWLGISTPFKGMRYLKRSGQGLIGQSEELDQLLCKILGEEMMQGKVIKIADDIYIGAPTPQETAENYRSVLQKLQECNIKISAGKTKIFLKSVDCLGWVWTQGGFLKPSPHRVNALRNAKMEDIKCVKDMRSWLGLYKTLLPASKDLTLLLHPFDLVVADKKSKDPIEWDRQLQHDFLQATEQLDKLQQLYLPHPSDQLLIEVDAAKVQPGIGHTVYAIKEGRKIPVAFHSAKLQESQAKWNCCEIEALAFATAIKAEYDLLKESKNPILVSPDSKPVADAINLVRKGLYSSSPRIQSFITNINRLPLKVQLASGKLKQNQSSDYQSRHPSECTADHCSICSFISETSDSVLLPSLNAIAPELTLSNKEAWFKIQQEQKATRKAAFLLSTGKTATKESGSLNSEVKQLCRKANVTKKGMLIVKSQTNKYSTNHRELIVVPSTHLPALLWQIHNSLQHPTRSQLKAHFDKMFYSVGLTPTLDRLYQECFYCSTQKAIPNITRHKTITDVKVPGTHFNADVIKRQTQMIFTIRDHFSSFTSAKIIKSETSQDLKSAIIELISPIKLAGQCYVRVDNAKGFQPLLENKDSDLSKLQIKVEATDCFNKNANAIVDRACYELEQQLKRLEPAGKQINNTTLQLAVTALNQMLRRQGQISSYEMHFNRDNHTGDNLNLDYQKIREEQIEKRDKHNEKHNMKVPDSVTTPSQGDIVIIKNKPNKHIARDVFVVADVMEKEEKVKVQKILNPHSVNPKLRAKQYVTSMDRVYTTKPAFRNHNFPITTSLPEKSKPSVLKPLKSHDNSDDEQEDSFYYVLPQQRIRTSNSEQPPPLPSTPPPLPLSLPPSLNPVLENESPSQREILHNILPQDVPLPISPENQQENSISPVPSEPNLSMEHLFNNQEYQDNSNFFYRPQNITVPKPQLYQTLENELAQRPNTVEARLKKSGQSSIRPSQFRRSYSASDISYRPIRKAKINALKKFSNVPQHDGPISLPSSIEPSPENTICTKDSNSSLDFAWDYEQEIPESPDSTQNFFSMLNLNTSYIAGSTDMYPSEFQEEIVNTFDTSLDYLEREPEFRRPHVICNHQCHDHGSALQGEGGRQPPPNESLI